MPDLSIVGEILLRLQGRGGLDAAAQLDKTGASARGATRDLGGADRAVAGLGRTLTRFVGAGAIVAFARSSLTEFARVERGTNALRFVLDQLGLDAARSLPKVVAELERLEAAGGPVLAETVPAFQRLVGVTKDVPAALEAVRLAADAAESGTVDLGTAASSLAAILQGRAKEAAQTLGLELRKVDGELKTNAELLDEARVKFAGLGAAIDDASDKVDRATAAQLRFKRAVGEAVPPIVSAFGFVVDFARKSAETIGAAFGFMFNVVMDGMLATARTLAAGFDLRKLLTEGPRAFLASVAAEVASGVRAIDASVVVALEQQREIWTRAGTTAGADEAAARAAAFATLTEQARRAQIEKDAEADAERAEKARKAAEKLAEERASFEVEADDTLLARKIAIAKEGTAERLALEIALLRRVRDRALAEADRLGASRLVIAEGFLLAEEELRARFAADAAEKEQEREERRRERMQQLSDEIFALELEAAEENLAERERLELEHLESTLAAELAATELTEAQKTLIVRKNELTKRQIRARTAAEAERRARDEAAAEREKQELIVGAAFAAAEAAFGKSKALAIAEIIVRTAMGVMAALAQYPPNIPLAAFIAAMGALQLRRVQETSLGGGGGSAAVGVGGSGATQATAPAAATATPGFQGPGGSQPQQPFGGTREPSITIHGNIYGGRVGMRELAREIDRARREDRRFVS